MKVIIAKDYDELSKEAFKIVKAELDKNDSLVLGLATGSSPVGLYKEMIKDHKENGTSYKNVKTVNLDEYRGLDYSSDQSYVYFMRENLFDHIDINLNNTNIENGLAKDADKECERYNKVLETLVPDVQVLGIGSNGHIAFNEPNTPWDSVTHVVNICESTIKDNARFFKSIDEVPRQAYTMGLKNIMMSKNIIVVANGKNKAKAVLGMVKGKLTPEVPASILQLHPNVTVIVTEDAAELIK